MDLSSPGAESATTSFETIEAVQAFGNDTRIDTTQLRPSAVGQEGVGDLITGQTATTGLVFVADQTTNITEFTLTDNYNRGMLAPAEAWIQVNGFTWPSAQFAMGNFPVSVFNNFGISDGINIVTTVACRNNSGATVQLQVTAYFRVITNSSTNPATATGTAT